LIPEQPLAGMFQREAIMAAAWQISGDYFENCNCSVVCPCLVSKSVPLTSKPTEGVCDVALLFHIDKGSYQSTALDDLNVALAVHTPGPMAEGNWSVAAYIDERPTKSRRRLWAPFSREQPADPWRILRH
jgi:hypothetical protein